MRPGKCVAIADHLQKSIYQINTHVQPCTSVYKMLDYVSSSECWAVNGAPQPQNHPKLMINSQQETSKGDNLCCKIRVQNWFQNHTTTANLGSLSIRLLWLQLHTVCCHQNILMESHCPKVLFLATTRTVTFHWRATSELNILMESHCPKVLFLVTTRTVTFHRRAASELKICN